MKTSSKHIPSMVGIVLLVVGVGVAGATVVQDNLPPSWGWLRALSSPFRWELTPQHAPIDVYIGFNLVPAVFVVVSALLIFVVARRVAGGFVPAFFGLWGAVVAGGVIAAIVSVFYNELVLDYPTFTPGGDSILDHLQYGIDVVLDAAAFAGLWVALAVAVTMEIVGPSHVDPFPSVSDPTASNPYAGGPLDPSPPVTPMPPTPPPTTSQPPVVPPPSASPETVDPTSVTDEGSTP